VPIAPINEHRDAGTPEDEVCTPIQPRERPDVNSVPQLQRVGRAPYDLSIPYDRPVRGRARSRRQPTDSRAYNNEKVKCATPEGERWRELFTGNPIGSSR
jgi:hypothetical protein